MADHKSLFIGLMSGTSMDGVDGALVSFDDGATQPMQMLGSSYVPFPANLRGDLMALQSAGHNEIHREALAANELSALYADCAHELLHQAQLPASAVRAIGCHGQTIRHSPQQGYTRQTNNPALLAEMTGIDVIADFRSRDVAAGGQGAPLVPAFHQAVFGKSGAVRVVVYIGGMSNISVLDNVNQRITGFDTGPGNVLLDMWALRHLGQAFDASGAWAASGVVRQELLSQLLREPFFALPPPKSTGRDLFDNTWLNRQLAQCREFAPEDVQATLTALTAHTLADAIAAHAAKTDAVFICGGGACNDELLRQLQTALTERKINAQVESTAVLGVSPNHVEALAFAWLAHRFDARRAGNLPEVTGADGPRILGALYPA
jgi:anhydro-N-acetylmuramic acid kinase